MSNKFAFLANCYKDYKRDKQFFDQNLKKNLYFYFAKFEVTVSSASILQIIFPVDFKIP